MKKNLLVSVLVTLGANAAFASQNSIHHEKVIDGVFEMIERATGEQNSTPAADDSCMIYTELTLKSLGGNRGTATLVNRLHGNCEIHVEPMKRSYQIRAKKADCGSTEYLSEYAASAKLIAIVDHRTRVCDDVVVHLVTMNEITEGVDVSYVSMSPSLTANATISGKMTRIYAIGGETTGTAIATESGLIEVDLSGVDAKKFDDLEGKMVLVSGQYKTVFGVERPVYQVLVVEVLRVL